jgi:hypothetical protein
MAILEKEVLIEITYTTSEHYEKLGYEIPRYLDKRGVLRIKKIKTLVKTEHLSKGASVRIVKICDECGKTEHNKRFVDILNQRENGDGKDRCFKCGKKRKGYLQSISISYEKSLEFCAKRDNKEYLLNEFSSKNERKPDQVAYQSNHTFIWNCFKCGSEYPMRMNNRTSINQNSCPYCSGQKVNYTNCLATTHPDIIKFLTNSEDAHKYTNGSGSKINFTCPDCRDISKKSISNVVRHGFACSKCGDGLSYPEKFMTNLLMQLKMEFKSQKYFDWSANKRYDFYIPYSHAIVETHGAQHYNERTFNYLGGKSLKEEQENDQLKEKLAIENGIEHYIVINCSVSKPEFIKQEIIRSELSNLLNLNNVNWHECNKYACNSLVKLVCDLYEKEPRSTVELGELLGLERSTVCRYLNQGAKLGMCSYDGKEVQKELGRLNGGKNAIKIVQLSLDGEFIKEWDSARDMGRGLGIHSAVIPKVCSGVLNQTGGFRFMYKDDYEKNGILPSKDNRPKVVQLSKEGEFIKEYRNANDANKALGKVKTAVKSIHLCCKGEYKTAFGYKWMYKEDYDKQFNKVLITK